MSDLVGNPKARFSHDTAQVEQMRRVTVKFLNFRTPENFAVINLKFKQKRQNLGEFCQKDANGKANSEDPDQTAPLIWVCTVWPKVFVQKFRIFMVVVFFLNWGFEHPCKQYFSHIKTMPLNLKDFYRT